MENRHDNKRLADELQRERQMKRILWLDDDPRNVDSLVYELERHDFKAILVSTESDAMDELAGAAPPVLLVQDLWRPPSNAQVKGGTPRNAAGQPEESGWRFYREALRPHFPELPVLICTFDAHLSRNRQQADDFNLYMFQKASGPASGLIPTINSILASQRSILDPRNYSPATLLLDFNKVNAKLIEHLSRQPRDIHNLCWAAFEDLVDRLLRELGYETKRTPLSHDGGVDIWALKRSDLGDILYVLFLAMFVLIALDLLDGGGGGGKRARMPVT